MNKTQLNQNQAEKPIENCRKQCFAHAFARYFQEMELIDEYKSLCLKYPLPVLSLAWERVGRTPRDALSGASQQNNLRVLLDKLSQESLDSSPSPPDKSVKL